MNTEAPSILADDLPEEYASVTVTIDHLVMSAHRDGHVVVKNVWSTESAVESLLAQIDYFEDSAIFCDPGIINMIAKGNERAAVFVYTVNDEQTNVIVDAAVWADTISNKEMSQGTVLGAHASLIALATDLKASASAAGKESRVLAFITD